MLAAVPPWITPTVTTAGMVGLTSRDTTVCNCATSIAAATMGSIVVCGYAACPELPRTTISKRSDAARQAPCTKPKLPTGMSG